MDNQFDVAVAGGGIAGLTAGLTAARLGRKTLVFTGDLLGGQLLSIEKIDGYPGFPEGVPGYDLGPMAQEQAQAAGAEFLTGAVERLETRDGRWLLATTEGEYSARTMIIATGADLKQLGVPGEDRLRGKGISHCATCDGPLLRDRPTAIAGGGDSALQEALTLAQFASKVVILQRDARLSGQAIYRESVAANPKIEVRFNVVVEEVVGDSALSSLRVRDIGTGNVSDLATAGLFVYIGLTPNTAFLNNLLRLDSAGGVPTDSGMRTELPGVFAAGTVRSNAPARAASSAGEGATAAISADAYLNGDN